MVVVRLWSELLSEGFCMSGCCYSGCCHSGCCQSGCCQSSRSQSGYCQSGYCQSGRCQSGYCQSGSCQSCSQTGRQSNWVTTLLHSSVLVIYTARNLPWRQLWDYPNVTQYLAGQTQTPIQSPRELIRNPNSPILWTGNRDPKLKNHPRGTNSTNPKVECIEWSQIN